MEIEILSKEVKLDEKTFAPWLTVTATIPIELQVQKPELNYLELQSSGNEEALNELYLKLGKEFFAQLKASDVKEPTKIAQVSDEEFKRNIDNFTKKI